MWTWVSDCAFSEDDEEEVVLEESQVTQEMLDEYLVRLLTRELLDLICKLGFSILGECPYAEWAGVNTDVKIICELFDFNIVMMKFLCLCKAVHEGETGVNFDSKQVCLLNNTHFRHILVIWNLDVYETLHSGTGCPSER